MEIEKGIRHTGTGHGGCVAFILAVFSAVLLLASGLAGSTELLYAFVGVGAAALFLGCVAIAGNRSDRFGWAALGLLAVTFALVALAAAGLTGSD